jgi:hypothetical protein
MAGFKVWTTGDLVNASDFNNYLQEQVIMRFADSTARDSQVSSPEEGMFCFLQDTNVLQFYNGSSWVNFIGEGDISGVTAGAGLSGGGTSGAVSLALDINGQSSTTVASSDEIIFGDVSDSNNFKKTTAQSIADLASVTSLITNVTVKVADDGSGSQNVFYMLSGSDTGAGTRSPVLDVYFGMKVRFDTSDSSLSGHNFKFSTTADGSHGGGSEFTTNVTTNGTPGSSGAYTQLEITPETLGIAGATPTLYYYCSNHSGMGGSGYLSLSPRTDYADIGLVIALG